MPDEPDNILQDMKDKEFAIELTEQDLQTKVDGKTIYMWIGEVSAIFFDMIAEKYPKQVQETLKLTEHDKQLVSLGLSPLVDVVIQKLGLTADEILAIGVCAMVFLPRIAIMIRYRPKNKKVKKDEQQTKNQP